MGIRADSGNRGQGTPCAQPLGMRPIILAVIALSSPAFAGRTGGGSTGGGGSGPLGQVSHGLATATAATRTPGGGAMPEGSNQPVTYDCDRYLRDRERDASIRSTLLDHDCRGYLVTDTVVEREGGVASADPGAIVTGFAGAQKVVGSDGSLSLALAVVDRRVRLDASITQYYETEMSGARVTMLAPELGLGVNLAGAGPTRLWLETGVMYLKTGDPAGDASESGPTIGARIEHRVSPDLAVAGVVEGAYLQDGVRGLAGRVGVRFHHVEAAVRVLDLNVGPALYGPEIGVGF